MKSGIASLLCKSRVNIKYHSPALDLISLQIMAPYMFVGCLKCERAVVLKQFISIEFPPVYCEGSIMTS